MYAKMVTGEHSQQYHYMKIELLHVAVILSCRRQMPILLISVVEVYYVQHQRAIHFNCLML